MPEENINELPKWFRKISNVAYWCSYGIIVLFLAFKVPFINSGFSPTFLSYVNLGLVIIGMPAVILSGPRIIDTIKKIKINDGK